ncbi:MAG: prepilin-type N-terminal cleavage/methylation domain-containing protein [Epsilonproteobacteria bacterium]|nr:prepilin-type N-terminal cleavage/methylation domain-containing protein [Campylobacterota bacterium]
MKNFKSAFTMVELVFVIVVVGILAGVAIPKLAATRDDAYISKAKTQVASVRNALSMERQKRILRGDFTAITAVGDATTVFGKFSKDKDNVQADVMEYPVASKNTNNNWEFKADEYIYHSNALGGDVKFKIENGKFVCVDLTSYGCKQLTE